MKEKIILLVVLCFAFSIAAQDLSDLLRQPLPQDPNLLTGVLENGVRYIIRRNEQPTNRAELRLIVDIGAIDEEEDQLGLAHFAEHMLFKGTKSFTKQEMINYLNSIGLGFGGGLNAFTSQQNTAYTLSAPTEEPEQLEKAFKILSEMAFHAAFDEAELEEERGVIIEEWRMYQGASQRIRDQVLKVMLANSRYAERTPIGNLDVLQNFELETIKRFYNDWYRPDLQTVLVIGDIEPKQIESLIETYFGAEPRSENPRQREKFEVPDHEEPLALVAIDSEMSYTSVQLVWKHEPTAFQTIEDFFRNMITLLGTDMLNARLEELSRSPEAPFSYAGSYQTNLTYTKSGFIMNAYTDEDKVLEATTALLTEAERVNQHGFTLGELQRAKSRVLANMEKRAADMDKELSGRLTWSYLRDIMNRNALISEEQRLQLFNALKDAIGLEQINQAIASSITDHNFVITVTGPEKEGLEYPSNEELLAVRSRVKEMPVAAYLDDIIDEPLMAAIPSPGEILNEKVFTEAGIKRWELSNGAVVYAKKTDFKNDEVLFEAISPGGFSLYSPEDAITARNAASIIMESGFANFDKITLDKVLSGTIVNLSASIDRESEGFSGNFAPRFMETFFQVLYQYATQPRKCEQSFQTYIQRRITFTQNRGLNPETVFWDSVSVILQENNPYLQPQTSTDLREIELARAMEIYHDRFADFSDFTFFFVGNFNEEELQEYCKTYLANLPSTNRQESFRDILKPIRDRMETHTVHIGKDDKSIVFGHSGAEHPHSPELVTEFNALQLLLNEKLRLAIREKLSGVYYVGIQSGLDKKPREKFQFQTILFCAPERKDELFEATYTTLDSVRAGFITDEDVTFVKTTLLRNLETQEIRNHYYLNQMKNNVWNEVPVDDYVNQKERIEAVSKESLHKTAEHFLIHDRSLIQVNKLPNE